MEQVLAPDTLIECGNYLSGQWENGGGAPLDVASPYTGSTVGRIHESTAADVARVAAAAKEAQVAWGATPMKERAQVLFRFRDILLRDLDKIAQCVSLENGKTVAESRAGVLKGVEVLEFALSLQNLDEGGKMEVSRGVFCEYRREPLGVVAGITPFNFPAMVPMWMIPIAIALGNAFILKPSEKTPLTAVHLADSLAEAGLPAGVFSVVQGGRNAVEAVIDHPDIGAVGFVGSTRVAQIVYQRGTALGKRVLALGGAKNHIFLMPDADPDMAGQGISDSFTGCAGQRCMAASVLLAVGQVDHVLDKVVERASSATLGDSMGALITGEQVAFLHQAIENAEKAGAKIILDGRNPSVPDPYKDGYWLGPTILDQVDPQSEAALRELFGPIMSIVRCNTLSEAMAVENANPYGNAASIFTSSGAMAERVANEAKAAMVGVNVGIPVPREPFSFGGMNHSKFGHGDITGRHSLDFWSNIKKITTKWRMQRDQTWMS